MVDKSVRKCLGIPVALCGMAGFTGGCEEPSRRPSLPENWGGVGRPLGSNILLGTKVSAALRPQRAKVT